MPKPWAKYEVEWIDHDKFRALPGNAICLWVEGKKYADARHTNGFLPAYEVKHWRFYSKKNVELLTTSIGPKSSSPEAALYAPLWEACENGWQMHDYLDHNDAGEVVVARIAKAEAKRAADRKRQQEWRAQKDAERRAANEGAPAGVIERRVTPPVTADVTRPVTPPVTRDVTPVTPLSQGEQRTENREQIQKRDVPEPAAAHRPTRRPQFQNQRFVVHRWQVEELISMLGPQADTFDLDEWLMTGALERANEEVAIIPDWWKWLKAETLREAKRRGLPIATPDHHPLGKQTTRLAQAVANIQREGR